MLKELDPRKMIDTGCLLVLTGMVTGCVRSLQLSSLQEQSLAVIQCLAVRQASEVILERILPYIQHYFSSPVTAVGTAAVHCLVTRVVFLGPHFGNF